MRALLSAVLLLLSLVHAASAEEILKRAEAFLQAAPWRAYLVGKLRLPSGEVSETRIRVRVLPKEAIARLEFEAPDAVADNFVILTPKKVYNYLFLTNQVIVYPRAKAKIEGLGLSLSQFGDPGRIAERTDLAWKLGGEEKTGAGPAFLLVGVPKDPQAAGVSRFEVWVLKEPPRPYRFRVYDPDGELIAELTWKDFKRVRLSREALLAYPPDAEVIEK